MNVDENEQQLLSTHITNIEIPLTDIEEVIPYIIPEIYDWNTSLISQNCRDGDIHRLRLFIEYSRQMSSCAKHATEIIDRLDVDTGLSPLHHAARYQQLHISNGNINACDKYLLTSLHYAVTRNNLSGVKQLITLNANIESKDRQGIRPLHLAYKEGYLSIIEYLINQGTKINVIDTDYWTPIHYACAKRHLDIP